MFLLLLLLSEGCVSPFSLGLFVSSLNVQLFARAVSFVVFFFSVRVLFSGKVLETSLSKIFWCNLQCCFFGGAIGRCVFISVSAQSSFPEDGFLAWFGPFESLLWLLFFLVPVARADPHTKQLSASPFDTDFPACSVWRKRRVNYLAVIFCDLPFHCLCPFLPFTWGLHPKPKACTHEF